MKEPTIHRSTSLIRRDDGSLDAIVRQRVRRDETARRAARGLVPDAATHPRGALIHAF